MQPFLRVLPSKEPLWHPIEMHTTEQFLDAYVYGAILTY